MITFRSENNSFSNQILEEIYYFPGTIPDFAIVTGEKTMMNKNLILSELIYKGEEMIDKCPGFTYMIII